MVDYKIKDFNEEYPNIPFPWYVELSKHECDEIYSILAKGMGMHSEEWIPYALHRPMEDICRYLNINPDNDLNVINLLNDINIPLPEDIYIQWDLVYELDIMKLNDFSNYLYDLWYPSVNIYIFDKTFTWILFITHFENIGLIRLNKENNSIYSLERLDLNKCELRHIPSEIYEMKKLKWINLRWNPIPKEEIKSLIKALPDCEVTFGGKPR